MARAIDHALVECWCRTTAGLPACRRALTLEPTPERAARRINRSRTSFALLRAATGVPDDERWNLLLLVGSTFEVAVGAVSADRVGLLAIGDED